MYGNPLPAVRKAVSCLLAVMLLSFSLGGPVLARNRSNVSGVVLDSSGAAVGDALVSLLSAQQVTAGTAKTDSQGRFTLADIGVGQYLLVITSRGFADHQQTITVGPAVIDNLEVKLNPSLFKEEVTVTTNPGVVESTGTVSQQVNVISEAQIEERAKSIVAQVANEEV
jgi:Carboxypeptidase regulatory-like domain